MTMVPVAFIIAPMIQLFVADATADTAHLNTRTDCRCSYMLVIPAIVPSTLSAYSVVGEREQGTLEPVLTTPIHREEFLIGNALVAFVPGLVIAYMVFRIFSPPRPASARGAPSPSTQRSTFQKQEEINNGRNAEADA